MSKIIYLIILIYTCSSVFANDIVKINNSTVLFPNKNESINILKKEDEYIKRLSKFDIESRSGININNQTINKYCEFLGNESVEWTQEEIKKISKIMENISKKTSNLDLRLPDKINIVKTTGKEEGDAAYTRENTIILPISNIQKSEDELEKLLVHEIFHIISRNNSELREKLYNIIGFKKCAELEFPKELKEVKITNPDGYLNNYYISIEIKGKEVNVIPILFSNENYDVKTQKSFFEYLQFYLLEVYIEDSIVKPVYKRNKLSLLRENKSYFDQVGENTNYIIHPDEILADNFVILVNKDNNIKSKGIINQMQEILDK